MSMGRTHVLYHNDVCQITYEIWLGRYCSEILRNVHAQNYTSNEIYEAWSYLCTIVILVSVFKLLTYNLKSKKIPTEFYTIGGTCNLSLYEVCWCCFRGKTSPAFYYFAETIPLAKKNIIWIFYFAVLIIYYNLIYTFNLNIFMRSNVWKQREMIL